MDDKNFTLLRNNLWRFKNIFQYVYSSSYPDIYCSTEQRGFIIKSSFYIVYKNYKDKKTRTFREEPAKFQIERQNSFENELKPVKNNSDEETTGRQKEKKKTWASWKIKELKKKKWMKLNSGNG